jgi:hypothetical protein
MVDKTGYKPAITGLHGTGSGEEVLGSVATDWSEEEKSTLINITNHQPYLVKMGSDHHLRAITPHMKDDVAQRVCAYLIYTTLCFTHDLGGKHLFVARNGMGLTKVVELV